MASVMYIMCRYKTNDSSENLSRFFIFWMLTCVGANPSSCVGGVRAFYDDIIIKSSGSSI